MARYAAQRARELAELGLCGYVLKKDSPSCGMERVRVYGAARRPPRATGAACSPRAAASGCPLLPVEEEGRLADAGLRENFIERVFAYRRLRALLRRRAGRSASWCAFHTAHKLLLLAHSEPRYRRSAGWSRARRRCRARSCARATRRELHGRASRARHAARHVNVLQHMVGHLRGGLEPSDARELAELIDDYRRGLAPLVVPLTLLRHHVRRLEVAYLGGQVYLENPHARVGAWR